jgi:SOS-response transcriptional repressor LexA
MRCPDALDSDHHHATNFTVTMHPLSPRQRKVYDRLLEHHRRTGGTPDLSEFARGLGVTYVTLKQHLEALAHKGYLSFEGRGRGRSPVRRLPAAATGVPVLGAIPAGPLAEAVADAEGYLPLPGLGERWFALRVHGDSMADLIQADDVVLFERGAPPRDGLICAVRSPTTTSRSSTSTARDAIASACGPTTAPSPTASSRPATCRSTASTKGLLRGDVLDVLLHD